MLAQTLAAEDIFCVENAHEDARFSQSPVVVSGPRICSYAGIALRAADASVVGILAVADAQPREFSAEQRDALRDFGTITSAIVVSTRELALRRLMSRAVEEAMDFVILTDASRPSQGGPFIEYINASLLHALGYTADEVEGAPYSHLFSSGNDPATLESIAQNIELAKDNEKEVRLKRKDGSTLWAEFAGRPLIGPDGQATHWVSVGRDISSNRQTLTQMAALVNAIDTVAEPVEIYTRENGEYALAFQNAAADEGFSERVDRMLADPSNRERLNRGKGVVAVEERIVLRPCGAGESIICVRRKPARTTIGRSS